MPQEEALALLIRIGQSGCDTVLKRMNRRYDTARYYESVELLRRYGVTQVDVLK